MSAGEPNRSSPEQSVVARRGEWPTWNTRFLLFTGKGGVGKTTVAAASAVALADRARQVLLVSTDPASNLEDVLATKTGEDPTPVKSVVGLSAMNVDPEAAASEYRARVLDPLRGVVPEAEWRSVEEQLSGQCTVEVAAFDKFSTLLANPDVTAEFDHVVFDTAPTGHTLRLLSLPAAWSTYIATAPRGASCLGPAAALESKRELYLASVDALGDAARTTVVLVSRPDARALGEAARAGSELGALGVENQQLVVNGILTDPLVGDPVAESFARRQRDALDRMSPALSHLPTLHVPLVGYDLIGIEALRALAGAGPAPILNAPGNDEARRIERLDALIEELATAGPGLIMVMGKGGVGKTTIAVAIARRLAELGCRTHLSTTDPAGQPADMFGANVPEHLTLSRIDPVAEVRRYVDDKLRNASELDPARRALLEEDLRSPCTEELAVFQAFSDLLRLGRDQHVVIDTAPSGHTLLLLDLTGAYHRDVMRTAPEVLGRITTPLMRLQDPDQTRVLLVTLAETTPVHEAAMLQTDLRRAGIEPFGWIINASLAASDTRDPILSRRAQLEHPHLRRVHDELATRCWIAPWET